MKISPRMLRVLTIFAAFLFITLAIIALWYWLSFTEVTFEIDGQRQIVRVRANTVGEAIEAAHILLEPADLVSPDLNTSLKQTPIITIDKAEQIAIDVNGEITRHYTHLTDPAMILAEAGFTLTSDDVLLINGIPELEYAESHIPPRIIQIQRGYTVQIDDGGVNAEQRTTSETVSGALRSTGLTFYLADRIFPSLESNLSDGLSITIERSKSVQIQVDGQMIVTRAHGETIGEVLAALGIALGGQDYTIPAESTPFRGNQQIRVVRVTDEIQAQIEAVPYETVYEPDPELSLDEESVRQEGQNGEQESRIRIRYEDGREASRIQLENAIMVPPVNEIIAYGTKIETRTLDTPDGVLSYWRVIPMQLQPDSELATGTAAADPEIIPTGTTLYIEGLGQVQVVEAGAELGYSLRLGAEDYQPSAGSVNIYLLLPVPENIPYRLPE